MSRVRTVLGSITKSSKGATKIEVLDGHFISSAAKQNKWDGGETGNTYHEYKAPEKKEEQLKEIIFSGWWSPDYVGVGSFKRDSRGPKSYLEKTVYFQLNVSKDVPVGTNITFQLWDYDTGFFLDYLNLDDDKLDGKKVYRNAAVREVDGKNRITIELFLNPKWNSDLIADKGYFKDGCLDFYWTWKYNDTNWKSDTNLLSVYPSETTLYIKPAYEGYGFPEIRTADGDIVVFSAGIGISSDEPSDALKSELNTISNEIKAKAFGKVRERLSTFSDELRHSIAIKQLKKGHLANNMSKIEFSRRIYTQAIFDNNSKIFTVTKAANFGYRKNEKLITTKGISQLDYFKEVGALNTVAKSSKELLGIFDFGSDLLAFVMDDNPTLILTSFAPLDFIVAVLAPSILDPIKEMWDTVVYEQAERAKDKGIDGIYDFLQTNGGRDERYGYDVTEINQFAFNKLLRGEFKNLEELRENRMIKSKCKNENFSLTYIIFHSKKYQEDKDVKIVFIEAVFINN